MINHCVSYCLLRLNQVNVHPTRKLPIICRQGDIEQWIHYSLYKSLFDFNTPA